MSSSTRPELSVVIPMLNESSHVDLLHARLVATLAPLGIDVSRWSMWKLVQLGAEGIIGEYVGRTYIESKRRPLYFVRESIGTPSATELP